MTRLAGIMIACRLADGKGLLPKGLARTAVALTWF
jgi:hypothetical protein